MNLKLGACSVMSQHPQRTSWTVESTINVKDDVVLQEQEPTGFMIPANLAGFKLVVSG